MPPKRVTTGRKQLKILRLLVDVQLAHSTEVKNIIDRAWGVTQHKHKKKDPVNAPPDASDAKSQERLQFIPLGQDCSRKRYWVADGPCLSFRCLRPTSCLRVFV